MNLKRPGAWMAAALLTGAALLAAGGAESARQADIRNTKHNLSVSGPGTVKATQETQICVFCHIPHGAEDIPRAPLWNRRVYGEGGYPTQTYTPYTSGSLNALGLDQPDGSSKLCLSCHDGTMAIGAVNVLNGALTDRDPTTEDITMSGVKAGTKSIPSGQGDDTGFTRNLGTDLTNDHPISFTFDTSLATDDGELYNPSDVNVDWIGLRQALTSPHPTLPLEPDALNNPKLQCVTCHDPHIRDAELTYSIKFLRLNRFQAANTTPADGAFNQTNDIICLGCHQKEGWGKSAHAHSSVADEAYKSGASGDPADLREFPNGIRVYEASCLNCHDTHTVKGARRLLREGTDDTSTPQSGSGKSAIEKTCYQCHASSSASILTSVTSVPNIKDEFELSAYRMPITTSDQPAASEAHNIQDGDHTETPASLGKTDLTNRHAECPDCHNPHRLTKKQTIAADASTPDSSAFHPHASGASHTNIVSGALRGTWGVEPLNHYSSTAFGTEPNNFDVKKGDPGNNASTNVSDSWVTREYQICFKCHSNYAYDTPPSLGSFTGGTSSGTNSLTQYTNQAMEFQSPNSHQGEGTFANPGAGSSFLTNNHRGWHPVVNGTGRDWARTWATNSPFTNARGTQTMYCSDCHGNSTGTNKTVVPDSGKPWGPHGSSWPFILKGRWDTTTGGSGRESPTQDALCFKCHDADTYAHRNGGSNTGFYGGGKGNLHAYHTDKMERMRCMWCHVAVPHGYKNKALLVNLNDVGPEGGQSANYEIDADTASYPYYYGPYYNGAVNKIINFKQSRNWADSDCGSKGNKDSGGASSGKDWMRNVCQSKAP